MPKSARTKVTAETLGELCLDHLTADPELLARFMTDVGYDPAGLRRALGSFELGLALIDWFAQREPPMVALCAANAIHPEDFMAVWHRLNPAS